MVSIGFKIKRKSKEEFLRLMEDKLREIFGLRIKKLEKSSIRKDRRFNIYIDKYSLIGDKNNLLELSIFDSFGEADYLNVSYSFDIKQLTDEYKKKIIDTIGWAVNLSMVIHCSGSNQREDKKFLYYTPIIVCDPKKDEEFKTINFDSLKPDYKKKIGTKYVLFFDYKFKKGPSHDSSYYPLAYESAWIPIKIHYLSTNKEEESGVIVYSKREDKHKIDYIITGGKLFSGLKSGVKVNYEENLLKALNEANRLLKKMGKEIVDLEGTYKKILSGLKEYDKK